MFDSIGVFFQKIGAAIGTGLITLGGFFGAQPTQTPIIEDVVQETSIETETEVSAPANESKKTAAPSTGTQGTAPKPEVASTKSTLQIENIKSSVVENQAIITWTTTLPAESRLIFDNGEGRVFESENGLSTSHKINATGLEESEEYDYKITATTEDKKQNDDYFGTLYAYKKYTAAFGTSENDCRIIVIKDTAGHIAPNKTVTLRPTQVSGNVNAQKPSISATTNSSGEIKYCDTANTFLIKGEELDITISAL